MGRSRPNFSPKLEPIHRTTRKHETGPHKICSDSEKITDISGGPEIFRTFRTQTNKHKPNYTPISK